MNVIRKRHWLITGVLFAIAISLYVAGSSSGAAAVVLGAAVVETIAWISLATHPREPRTMQSKE